MCRARDETREPRWVVRRFAMQSRQEQAICEWMRTSGLISSINCPGRARSRGNERVPNTAAAGSRACQAARTKPQARRHLPHAVSATSSCTSHRIMPPQRRRAGAHSSTLRIVRRNHSPTNCQSNPTSAPYLIPFLPYSTSIGSEGAPLQPLMLFSAVVSPPVRSAINTISRQSCSTLFLRSKRNLSPQLLFNQA